MRIINLTQHKATPEQVAAGVVDMDDETRKEVIDLLTFDSLPTRQDIENRAHDLAEYAAMYEMSGDDYGEVYPTHAMIGGAPWLMSALEAELQDRFVTPIYAFSVRASVETTMPDGSVRKTNTFKHLGFI